MLALFAAIISAPSIIQLIERTGLLSRMEYFSHEYGLMFALFSGREQFLRDLLEDVWSRYSLIEQIFCADRQEMLQRLGHPVETDPADILGAFGLLGLHCYYGP